MLFYCCAGSSKSLLDYYRLIKFFFAGNGSAAYDDVGKGIVKQIHQDLLSFRKFNAVLIQQDEQDITFKL